MVIPTSSQRKRSVKDTIDAIKPFREGNTLKGLDIRKMIEEGRR